MNTKYKSIGGKRKMKSGASGIYAIKNKMNNKRYIGSSTNINRRLKAHLSDLRKGRGPKKIQKDFDKYGENSFEFSVVETTLKPRKELLKLEDYYIKKFNALSEDRKSTRLNSSHVAISYAVFCLKKK